MRTLSAVTHEHDVLLRDYVNRLYAMADCLGCDCLDTVGVVAGVAALRDLEQGLRERLLPHMDAVEAAVHPTLERIMDDREASAPMRHEHEEIRRLVARLGDIIDSIDDCIDRASVLMLRRVMLRLHVLLRTHLDEEELYLPILEDRMTAEGEAALARALDHMAEVHL
jgi:hypothetical protein